MYRDHIMRDNEKLKKLVLKLQDDIEEMKQKQFITLFYKRLLMDAEEQRKELVSLMLCLVCKKS